MSGQVVCSGVSHPVIHLFTHKINVIVTSAKKPTTTYEIGYHHHTRVVDAISCDGLAGCMCVCLHIIMMEGSSVAMILACCQVSSDVRYQVLTTHCLSHVSSQYDKYVDKLTL